MTLDELRQRFEMVLAQALPAATIQPPSLHAAMRYSVLNGGKRLRPLLVYSAGLAVGAPLERLDAPAIAVECLHAYSLIHDDLPAMDNDDLRRGQPTCHRAFDEATAILAGDALQALAFQWLTQPGPTDPSQRLEMIEGFARAAGSRGMVGGQALDLAFTGQSQPPNLVELENMHIHKTGALIRTSVRLGVHCADAVTPAVAASLDQYGKCLGLAFQIQDDILDETSTTAVLGKTVGADRQLGKATYPALMGLDGAREHGALLIRTALTQLVALDDRADRLRELARFVTARLN